MRHVRLAALAATSFLLAPAADPEVEAMTWARSNHSREFFLDEEALRVGTRAILQLVLDHQRGTAA